MNAKSQLQQTYPLSVGRKFFKKVADKVLIFVFCVAFLVVVFKLLTIPGSKADTETITYLKNIFLAVGGFAALLLVLYAWYVSVYIKIYHYDADDNFLTVKKGVVMPVEIHVQYLKIQDVYVDQDLWDRILGIYDVHIASATVTSGMEAHIDGLRKEHAEGLKQVLLGKISNGTNSIKSPGSQSVETPQVATTGPVSFSTTISNQNYPLSSRWVFATLITNFLLGILATIGIWSALFSSSDDGRGPSIYESLNLTNYSVTSLLLGFFILFNIGSIVYTLVWKNNYKFEFLPEFIYYYESFITTKQRQMPYKNIQDIEVKQGILERIFSIYSVSIKNASSTFVQKGKPAPDNSIKIQGLNKEDATFIAGELKRVLTNGSNFQMPGL